MKIRVFLTEKQQKLYKKIGADPGVVLWWVNKEIVKILLETENIYGVLNDLDEEKLVEALIDTAIRKKNKRKEVQAEERKRKAKEEARKKELGKLRSKHLENNL